MTTISSDSTANHPAKHLNNTFAIEENTSNYEGQSISNETFSITLVFLELCN